MIGGAVSMVFLLWSWWLGGEGDGLRRLSRHDRWMGENVGCGWICAKMSPPLSGHHVALLNALCVVGSMIFVVLFAAWQNCP